MELTQQITESSLLPKKAERLDDSLKSEEKIKQVFETKELAKSLRRSAMDLLARREHSAYELAQKLQTRYGYSPLIYQEINKLTEQNLQSDERFCEAYIISRARKGKGPIRIRYELKQKQVSECLIDKQFNVLNIDWFESALKVKFQRFGQFMVTDKVDWAKQARFLQYRGFDTDSIQFALSASVE